MAVKKKYKFLIILLIIIFLGALFYTFCIQVRHVKAGEVGITTSVGNPIDNEVGHTVNIVRGYVIFMPLYTDFVVYPTTLQTISYDRFEAYSKDGVPFYLEPSISYQINEKKVNLLYQATHLSLSDFNKNYLKELTITSYTNTLSRFSSDSLVANRELFENQLNSALLTKMAEVGLELKNITSNMKYPQLIEDAITLRVQAEQDTQIAERKLQEIVIKRKEDSLRYDVLTPLVIQKMFIDKWDGKMPAYGGEIVKIYGSIKDSIPNKK